jgi:hypothetical protein
MPASACDETLLAVMSRLFSFSAAASSPVTQLETSFGSLPTFAATSS